MYVCTKNIVMQVNSDDSKTRKCTDTLSLFMNHRIPEYLRIGNYKCISESTTIGLLSCIHETRFSYSFNNLVCHRLCTFQ